MEPKKRILHIIQSLDNGGCENMLLRTLPLLSSFEHRILALKTPGELASQMEASGIAVATVRQKNFFDLPSYFRLWQELRAFSPDVIITYLFHADVIGRFFIPFISKAPLLPFLRSTYNHPRYRLARWFEKTTHFLVPRYLVNSLAVKLYLEKEIGVAPKKITLIPNGIDFHAFEEEPWSNEIRKELGLPEDAFVITCVANLASNKGQQYLLEAFEKLFQIRKNVVLLLVGDGEERSALEKQKESLFARENIFFLGRRSDVPEILRASTCFVLPTRFEGMSNSLLEAMAAGLPVITTNIPENQELIKNEETGLLVPVKNAEALSSALQRIAKDPIFSKTIAEAAQNTARERFSLPTIALLWKETLTSL